MDWLMQLVWPLEESPPAIRWGPEGPDTDLPWYLRPFRYFALEERYPLPQWWYDPRVVDILQEWWEQRRTYAVPMGCVTGPGVLWGFFGLLWMTAFIICAPILSYHYLSTCPSEEEIKSTGGLAKVDDFPIWVFFLAFFLVAVWIMRKCMTFSLVPQLMVARKFGSPWDHLPFGCWFSKTVVSHLLSWLDVLSNAVMVVKTVKMRECSDYAKISADWGKVIDQSLLRVIPGLGRDIVQDAYVLYGLLLLQPLYALACTVPLEWGVSYDVGMNGPGNQRQFRNEYKTLRETKQNHGAALQTLGEACRMEAVTQQDLPFARGKLQAMLAEARRGMAPERRPEWQFRYFHLARVEVSRAFARFVLLGMVQTLGQSHLQISLTALAKESFGVTDLWALFSVSTTLLCCFLDLPDAFSILRFSNEVLHGLPEEMQADLPADANRERLIILWETRLLKFFCFVVYNFFVLYAFLKIYGYFFCPHHLINLNGCADW